MQISVNKNLDEYKDDFYKGLTLRQTILSILTVLTGTGVFLFFYGICGIGQVASLYLAFPAALPFAVSGFLKIHGMSPQEYFKRKRNVASQVLFQYEPALLEIEQRQEPEEKGKRQKKQPILETQEAMEARMKRNYEESNAGLQTAYNKNL